MRKIYYLIIVLVLGFAIFSTSSDNKFYGLSSEKVQISDLVNPSVHNYIFTNFFGNFIVQSGYKDITPGIKFHSTVVGMNNAFYYETLDGQINSGFLNYFIMSFYLFISISLWMIFIMLIGKGIRKLFKMNPVVKFEDLKPLLDEIYLSNKARIENERKLTWF